MTACPKCQVANTADAQVCGGCGLVFKKAATAHERTKTLSPPPRQPGNSSSRWRTPLVLIAISAAIGVKYSVSRLPELRRPFPAPTTTPVVVPVSPSTTPTPAAAAADTAAPSAVTPNGGPPPGWDKTVSVFERHRTVYMALSGAGLALALRKAMLATGGDVKLNDVKIDFQYLPQKESDGSESRYGVVFTAMELMDDRTTTYSPMSLLQILRKAIGDPSIAGLAFDPGHGATVFMKKDRLADLLRDLKSRGRDDPDEPFKSFVRMKSGAH